MRVFTKVILAGLVAVFFTACGGGSSSSGTDNSTPPEPTVELRGISIYPANNEFVISAGVGQKAQLEAQGMYWTEVPTADGGYTMEDHENKDITHLVTWESSDETVATVDSDGMFTALSVGDTTIEATYDGETGTYMVGVIPAFISSLIVTPSEKTINVSDTFTLTAVGLKTDGTTEPVNVFSWNTSNNAIATVDFLDGIVEGIAPGTVTITTDWGTTHEGASVKGEATVTVK